MAKLVSSNVHSLRKPTLERVSQRIGNMSRSIQWSLTLNHFQTLFQVKNRYQKMHTHFHTCALYMYGNVCTLYRSWWSLKRHAALGLHTLSVKNISMHAQHVSVCKVRK